ncbi:unnamed protein product [Caenorhabditis sp. 36 PRJEB53466]|nr:unnamed protein product [Caenorhabditis sp. 36 PRJEB53466]
MVLVASPESNRRWCTLLLDREESGTSPRNGAVSPSPEIVYTAIRQNNLKLLRNLATVQLFTGVAPSAEQNEENRRYFADQEFRRPRHKPDQNMVEYWVPPEKAQPPKKTTNGQAPPTGQPRKINQVCPTSAPNGKRAMKIPKVKEPRGENSSKKSSADQAPSAFRVMYWKVGKYFAKAGEAVNHQYQKVRMFRNRMKANKVAPIHTKVQSRHLELEPLCCLSSCLVRGGCTTVVVFELCYVVATALCIFEAFFRKKFALWEPLPKSFNGWFAHPIFYYSIAFYDISLFIIAVATARALVNFDKMTLRVHYFFCFFSFFVNLIFLVFTEEVTNSSSCQKYDDEVALVEYFMKITTPSNNFTLYKPNDVISFNDNEVGKLAIFLCARIDLVIEVVGSSPFIDARSRRSNYFSIVDYIVKGRRPETEYGFLHLNFTNGEKKTSFDVVLKLQLKSAPAKLSWEKDFEDFRKSQGVEAFHPPTPRCPREQNATNTLNLREIIVRSMLRLFLIDRYPAGERVLYFDMIKTKEDVTFNMTLSGNAPNALTRSWSVNTYGLAVCDTVLEPVTEGNWILQLEGGLASNNSVQTVESLVSALSKMNLPDLKTGKTEIERVVLYRDQESTNRVYTPQNDIFKVWRKQLPDDVLFEDELVFVLKGTGNKIKLTATSKQTGGVFVAYGNQLEHRVVTIPFEGVRNSLEYEELEVVVENEESKETRTYTVTVVFSLEASASAEEATNSSSCQTYGDEVASVGYFMKITTPSEAYTLYKPNDVIYFDENEVGKLGVWMYSSSVVTMEVVGSSPFIDASTRYTQYFSIVDYIVKGRRPETEYGFLHLNFTNAAKMTSYDVVLKLKLKSASAKLSWEKDLEDFKKSQGVEAFHHPPPRCPKDPNVKNYAKMREIIVRSMLRSFLIDRYPAGERVLFFLELTESDNYLVNITLAGTSPNALAQSHSIKADSHALCESVFEPVMEGNWTLTEEGGGVSSTFDVITTGSLVSALAKMNLPDLTTGKTEIERVILYRDHESTNRVYTLQNDVFNIWRQPLGNVWFEDELVFVLKGTGNKIKLTATSKQTGGVFVAYGNQLEHRVVTIPFEGVRDSLEYEKLEVIVENEYTEEKRTYIVNVRTGEEREIIDGEDEELVEEDGFSVIE